MSFSYSITVATSLDRVRLNLSDTRSEDYVFEDEEITAMLSSEGTTNAATAALIRVLLMDRARRAKSFSIQGLRLDDTKQIEALKDMLSIYGGDLPTLSAVMPALLPSDAGYIQTI